jgi:ribosomal protein L22
MGKARRERTLPENEAKAVARMLRVSPQKLNLVAQLIRGKKVDMALSDLQFSSKRIARDVKKCLESAIANAENNHDLDVDDLIVAEANARDDTEIVVLLTVFAGRDLAAKFIHLGQWLPFAADEAVCLRKYLVLDANAADIALLEFAHEPAHVIEIAITGVAVEQNRDTRRIRHEFEHIDNLRPACFVVVAHAKLCGNREAARPNALEAGFFGDPRADAVVGFENKLEPGGRDHAA